MAAKTTKTVGKESVTEKKEETKETVKEVSGTKKIIMLETYMGKAGVFYRGNSYTVDGKLAQDFIKNKDAKECM